MKDSEIVEELKVIGGLLHSQGEFLGFVERTGDKRVAGYSADAGRQAFKRVDRLIHELGGESALDWDGEPGDSAAA